MFSYERSELENIGCPYCEQSKQQGSAKQFLIFSVITKNKVLLKLLLNEVLLQSNVANN